MLGRPRLTAFSTIVIEKCPYCVHVTRLLTAVPFYQLCMQLSMVHVILNLLLNNCRFSFSSKINTHTHTHTSAHSTTFTPARMTTYILSTICQGRRIDLDYWPNGNGTDYYGYVTSFSQFRDEVARNCSESDLEFYITDRNGNSKEITSNRQLRAAVAHLNDRQVLGVNAYAAGDDRTEVWANVESDDDESESEEDDRHVHVATNRHLSAILKRFVPSNSECHHCDRTDWSGFGYVYYQSSDYSLCDSCYGRLPRSQKDTWVRCGLPWDDTVPSYPLYARSDNAVLDEVRHLQYLLTRLGYLSLNSTSSLTGSYQSRTKEAVRRFRKDYRIRGTDMTKYDEKTASKLAQVVRQYRRQGHLYL